MSLRPGATVTKDSDANLVYTWDWVNWLNAPATIASSAFVIDGAPDALLVIDNPSIVAGATSTKIRLTGGTVGKVYRVRNRVVTNESPAQTDDKSIFVRIRQE